MTAERCEEVLKQQYSNTTYKLKISVLLIDMMILCPKKCWHFYWNGPVMDSICQDL